jgi:uncharacterized protein YfaS (alpha-2-macroglobulin family)
MGSAGRWVRQGVLAAAGLMALLPGAAAVQVSVAPQGTWPEVGQVSLRFGAPAVVAGDPRAPAPATVRCQGPVPPARGRWVDAQRWLYEFDEPLPASTRCTVRIAEGFTPLAGELQGPREWGFASGPPRVVQVQPYEGAQIEEDQHFLLRFNGRPDSGTAARRAWCEVDGLGERISVRVVAGAERERVLAATARGQKPEQLLLLACQRPFPAATAVRLVWGPAAGVTGAQRWEWKVRERLQATFSCERENARSACMPLRPLRVQWNAPVPRAQALAVRLVPAGGGVPIAPRTPGEDGEGPVSEVLFVAPLPENTRFELQLPRDLKDESGRPLANASAFPLAVATGPMPPLAKFASAPFGVLEAPARAAEPALLPITLRHVQADLQGASAAGSVRMRRLDASTPDATLLQWLARVQRLHETEVSARAAGLPQAQWTEAVSERDAKGRSRTVQRERRVQTRSVPLLAGDRAATALPLPTPGPDAKTTEVLGLPLQGHGLHVVEVESRLLGDALLASRRPMYVRTSALVTPMAVHFKRGRSSSLAWVTTLERSRPVAGARVVVNDCRGQALWSGTTGADGIVRIDRGFDEEYGGYDEIPDPKDCLSRDGLFVTARSGSGQDAALAFVFSRWQQGIEPWRFGIATASGSAPEQQAHTVLDRTLLRVGETVSMKHFLRQLTERGLALPAREALPDRVVITHVGSGAEVSLPLAWPEGPRSAQSTWVIPKNAALGNYELGLQAGERRLPSGSFRVEAFRVPLLDARLAAPREPAVAPKALVLQAQINAQAGGPMPNLPLQLSALLRPLTPSFAQHPDFSFAPPRRPAGDSEEAHDEPAAQLVADKLAARTDAQGAARLSIASLPALEGPGEISAELSFDDPNGELQTVAQTIRVWPAALLVGLRPPGWGGAGTKTGLRFTALVVDLAGKPMAGRELQVVGRLHETSSTRSRIVGGFYAYDNRRSVKDLGLLCSGRSDAQGRLHCDVKPATGGEIELVAQTRDDAGRLAQAGSSVWVAGQGEHWFAQGNDDRIDVLPEQRSLQPGQMARLQVRMPFRHATALVTVEREGVTDARVVTLTGRNPVVELPVQADWTPNVHVGVLVLRGRVREAPWWSLFTWGWREPGAWWQAFRHGEPGAGAPTALVDLAKPGFKFGVATLEVGSAARRLDVQVTADRPPEQAYSVRETVQATVRVSHGGKPLAGVEVAFAAVDEGLLALRENTSWQLLEAMYAPRPWGVETATAQGELIGRRHYGRKALPPGGGGGRNPTRELFDTLLLWQGRLQLDAQGQARIAVPLNDALTRFRLVAVADDGGERFGSGSTTVRVSQDLQMLPGLAPLAREGDRIDVRYTLRNGSDRAMQVRTGLAVSVTEGRTPGPLPALQPQTVALQPGAAAEVGWTVTVPDGATRLQWLADAREDASQSGSAARPAQDRVQTLQTVEPLIPQRVWQSQLLQLDATAPVNLSLAEPSGALPARSAVQATLKPSLAGALPGVERWFRAYPYTCLEQQASRAIGLRDLTAWQALGEQVPAYLDADGLAHFFPPEPGSAARGSDVLTSYLLASAHAAGWSWPAAVQQAMLGGLAAFVEGRIERRSNAPRADRPQRLLAALEALSRHGRANGRMLSVVDFSPAAMAGWPTGALVDAWQLLRRVADAPQREQRLAEVQRLLRARLVDSSEALALAAEPPAWWLMDDTAAQSARLLLAVTQGDGAADWLPQAPRLLNGLLAQQQRGAWATTTANTWGRLAVEAFAKRLEPGTPTGRSSLTLQPAGGAAQSPWALDWSAQAEGGTQTLPLTASGASQQARLLARHEGSGKPWLTLQTLAAVPLSEPVAAGYRISRTVTPVQQKAPGRFSRGDVLRVRVQVDASADMGWVVLSDPVPTGATLLGSGLGRDSAIATQGERRDSSGWLAYEERRAEAWRAYWEWLPRGRHVVEYTLRLNSSGRFGLPPTRVEAMYAPGQFGEAPNALLEVQP